MTDFQNVSNAFGIELPNVAVDLGKPEDPKAWNIVYATPEYLFTAIPSNVKFTDGRIANPKSIVQLTLSDDDRNRVEFRKFDTRTRKSLVLDSRVISHMRQLGAALLELKRGKWEASTVTDTNGVVSEDVYDLIDRVSGIKYRVDMSRIGYIATSENGKWTTIKDPSGKYRMPSILQWDATGSRFRPNAGISKMLTSINSSINKSRRSDPVTGYSWHTILVRLLLDSKVVVMHESESEELTGESVWTEVTDGYRRHVWQEVGWNFKFFPIPTRHVSMSADGQLRYRAWRKGSETFITLNLLGGVGEYCPFAAERAELIGETIESGIQE